MVLLQRTAKSNVWRRYFFSLARGFGRIGLVVVLVYIYIIPPMPPMPIDVICVWYLGVSASNYS